MDPSALAGSLHEEVTRILAGLALVILVAKTCGALATRVSQPPVLGELVGGILLGNLVWLGVDRLEYLRSDAVLNVLAELGVVVLLFSIGLRSDLRELLRVGRSSLQVALLGVVTPFALGLGVSRLLLPGASELTHVFVGATLCATSVGITARVLEDLGSLESMEARIVLGAAVIDDVLGMLVLSVVTALAFAQTSGSSLSAWSVLLPLAKAAGFFGAAIVVGLVVSRRLLPLTARLHMHGLLLAGSLAVCFGLSALASWVGLAAIVGAFAAGLALDETVYQPFVSNGERGLEDLVDPIVGLLSPIFFVAMGMRVDLGALAGPGVLGFGIVLTVVAVLGKLVAGLGVAEPAVSRMAVGVGMVPRGEVGLIFAAVGSATLVAGAPALDAGTYAAMVLLVMATTLVTPPWLARTLGTSGGAASRGPA